jgi:NADH:flavin oxidoreductase / NADH oxidase family
MRRGGAVRDGRAQKLPLWATRTKSCMAVKRSFIQKPHFGKLFFQTTAKIPYKPNYEGSPEYMMGLRKDRDVLPLFAPFKIGQIALKSRIVMASMTRGSDGQSRTESGAIMSRNNSVMISSPRVRRRGRPRRIHSRSG